MSLLSRSSLVALAALFVLPACGASAADDALASGPACGDSSCFDAGTNADGAASDVASDIGKSDAAEESQVINALCGTGCLPDDPYACGGAGGGSGGVPDGGDDGAVDGGTGAVDAADAAYSKSPAPAPSPGSDASPGPTPDAVGGACQVTVGSGGAPVPACSPAGVGVDDSPCVSSADCAPGFACVGGESTGQCRPYCCASADSCAAGTWCTEKASRDALLMTPAVQLMLPVCVQGADCKLLVDAADSNCPDGLACTVVRNDGTLACLPPGTVEEGGACDTHDLRCGEGLVCSRSTKTCLKLCRIDFDDCGSGVCQAGTTSLPVDIGICVGGNRG